MWVGESDCTKLKIEGDKLKATRPIYAGKAVADVEFVGPAPYFATVRPNALTAGELNTANCSTGDRSGIAFGWVLKSAVEVW